VIKVISLSTSSPVDVHVEVLQLKRGCVGSKARSFAFFVELPVSGLRVYDRAGERV
jgi:hypothetical protein